jgi:hypothetical protein
MDGDSKALPSYTWAVSWHYIALLPRTSDRLRLLKVVHDRILISWFLNPCTSARRLSNLSSVSGMWRDGFDDWNIDEPEKCRSEIMNPLLLSGGGVHGLQERKVWVDGNEQRKVSNATCSMVAQALDDASFLSYWRLWVILRIGTWSDPHSGKTFCPCSDFSLWAITKPHVVYIHVMMIASTINLPRKVNLPSWFQSGILSTPLCALASNVGV